MCLITAYIVSEVDAKYYIFCRIHNKGHDSGYLRGTCCKLILAKLYQTIELYSRVEHTSKKFRVFKVIWSEKSKYYVLLINTRNDNYFFEMIK